jgi:hypothetical protein
MIVKQGEYWIIGCASKATLVKARVGASLIVAAKLPGLDFLLDPR